MGLFSRGKTLDDRYLEVLALAKTAHERPHPNPWPQIQELCWRLLKDCEPRIIDDPRAPIVTLATGKIAFLTELSAKNWHRVVAIGWMMATAIAQLDAQHEITPQPGLLAAFAKDLFRKAELTCYAAHRAGLPTPAAMIAEQLTSIRLGDRTLKRSVGSWATTSTAADHEAMLGTVAGRIDSARRPVVYDGDPGGLDAFYQTKLREDFADVDRARSGARVAMSYGLSLPLEAMRVTGRSLLYVGGGLTDGVAVLFDAAAIDDPARSIASSVELPGVDITAVERKISELHAVAAARRAREVTGTALSSHVEDLLGWLGESLWQPVLARWPHLRDRPLAVVPLGELAQLPLYTALIDDEPACAALDLTIAPSARSLVLAGEHPAATGAAFVAADPATGDDELPFVVPEANAVAAVHGVTPVIIGQPVGQQDEDRLRAAPAAMPPHESAGELLARLRASATIHLACHGVIRPSEPLDSALVLGGSLTLSTMLSEDLLPGTTMVLSACDLAGIGKHTPGEQLGFPAVLLAAGARSVIAALWPVPDANRTVRLMTRLHEELATAPATRALGRAVAGARDAGAPASLWASFTHFGA
ncbi:CHAT domain-containing protein [Actinophytocola sediminis]